MQTIREADGTVHTANQRAGEPEAHTVVDAGAWAKVPLS